MSGQSDYRKMHGVRMNSAALRAEIEQQGGEIIAKIARREPAKILAFKIGIKPRHSYNLRTERPASEWPTFLLMAQQYPELRAWVAKQLGFDSSPDAVAKLECIKRMIESMPEEGDQAQPDEDATP